MSPSCTFGLCRLPPEQRGSSEGRPCRLTSCFGCLCRQSEQEQFWSACAAGNLEAVVGLLETGLVDINAQSKNRRTGLLTACHSGRKLVAIKLIEAGAVLDTADINGWTALHWACRRAQLPVALKLVSSGCDVNLINAEQQTAFGVYGRSYRSVYGRSLSAVSVKAAVDDLQAAHTAFAEWYRVETIWKRRWPLLSVLVGCGYGYPPRAIKTVVTTRETGEAREAGGGASASGSEGRSQDQKQGLTMFAVFVCHDLMRIIVTFL